MKLYVRQELFTFNDVFYVKDAAGRDVYCVESEFFTFLKKFHVYDMNRTERVFVEQNLSFVTPELSVHIEGRECAKIIKEITFFSPEYTVEGPDWKVKGDFFDHDYEITQRGVPVAVINKEWLTWGDCYALEVFDPKDAMLALAVMLAIDFVLSRKN